MADESGLHWSVWSSDEDLSPRVLPGEAARYERRGLLGRGGMGEVELAWDCRLHREVAIKRPRDDAPESAGRLLLEEARLTAHLQHPGIVPVHDLGEGEDGRPWVVMDVFRGRTLADALEADADRLKWVRAVVAVADAVAYAHAAGVVHRDLKPSNVFVGEHGEVQVGDWGLAAVRPGQGWEAVLGDRSPVRAAGTPGYQAPEQADGAEPHPTADVYSLGALLWELLAGAVPPAPIPADAAAELVAVARKALSDRPDDRYPDAAAFADELRRWLDGRRVTAHVYTPIELVRRAAWAWRAPLTVAAGAGIAMVVLAGLSYDQTRRERDRAQAAEQATAEALAEADRSLALALIGQAEQAWEEGQVAEAEVLAAEAWVRDPSPTVAGLLGGLAVEPHPELLHTWTLPKGCRTRPTADGELYCAGPDGLSRWAPGGAAPLWTSELVIGDLAVVDGDIAVVARDEDSLAYLIRLDRDTGVERGRAVTHSTEAVRTGGGVVVQYSGNNLNYWRDGEQHAIRLCEGGTTRDVSLDPSGEQLVAGCSTLPIGIGPVGGTMTYLDAGLEQSVSSVAWTPRGVLLGGSKGDVRLIDASTGATLWHRFVATGPVGEFCLSPDRAVVVAVADRGGPVAVDVATGRVRATLPAIDRGDCAFQADGTLWTRGERLAAWRLPDAPPQAFHGEAGFTWARRLGDEWVGLTGLGGVQRWGAHGEAATLRWQERVLKYAVPMEDGQLWVASLSDNGIVAVDGDHHALIAHPLGFQFRRVGRLGSGRVWAVTYAPGIHVYDPRTETWSTAEGSDVQRFGEGWSEDDGDAAFLLDEQLGAWVMTDTDPPVARRVLDAPEVTAIAGTDRFLVLGERGALVVRDRDGGAVVWSVPLVSPAIDVTVRDGRIAVGLLDGAVQLHDLADGTLRARYEGHGERVASVSFEADGTVLSAGWDGWIRRWALPAPVDADAVRARWGLTLDEALAR